MGFVIGAFLGLILGWVIGMVWATALARQRAYQNMLQRLKVNDRTCAGMTLLGPLKQHDEVSERFRYLGVEPGPDS